MPAAEIEIGPNLFWRQFQQWEKDLGGATLVLRFRFMSLSLRPKSFLHGGKNNRVFDRECEGDCEGCFRPLQGLDKRHSPGLENFIPALAYCCF